MRASSPTVAVGSGQLAMDAVTASKVADNSIGAAAIADGGLQTRDLGDFSGSVSVDFKAFCPTPARWRSWPTRSRRRRARTT